MHPVSKAVQWLDPFQCGSGIWQCRWYEKWITGAEYRA